MGLAEKRWEEAIVSEGIVSSSKKALSAHSRCDVESFHVRHGCGRGAQKWNSSGCCNWPMISSTWVLMDARFKPKDMD